MKPGDIEVCHGSPDRPTKIESRQDDAWMRVWFLLAITWAVTVSAFLVILVMNPAERLSVAAFVVAGCYATFGVFLARTRSTKASRWRRAFSAALARLPRENMLRAVERGGQTGGRYTNSVLDEIECYESHIPGDCPLCGAE